jgi:hypothetical protein
VVVVVVVLWMGKFLKKNRAEEEDGALDLKVCEEK